MPFWALDHEQLDRRWIESGRGIEAILFKESELDHLPTLEKNVRHSGVAGPITLHYPMDSDYVGSRASYEYLQRFIGTADKLGAAGVVLHSNRFIRLGSGAVDYVAMRARHTDFLRGLDAELRGAPFWVGVENMPLVGDDGTDTDGIFVYPDDFSGFDFDCVRIVHDIAHWRGTLQSAAALTGQDVASTSLPAIRQPPLNAFAALMPRIAHLHVSAMAGIAIPFSGQVAVGGRVPGGEHDDHVYVTMMEPFLKMDLTASLEVAEVDYHDRQQLWRMFHWLSKQLLSE